MGTDNLIGLSLLCGPVSCLARTSISLASTLHPRQTPRPQGAQEDPSSTTGLSDSPNDTSEVTQRPNPAGTQVAARMREFMHYITNAFYGATGWNEDNTYKELNATARGMFTLYCYLFQLASLLTLTLAGRAHRLPPPPGPSSDPLIPRNPPLCDKLPTRQRWHRRWLHILPPQHHPPNKYCRPIRSDTPPGTLTVLPSPPRSWFPRPTMALGRRPAG